MSSNNSNEAEPWARARELAAQKLSGESPDKNESAVQGTPVEGTPVEGAADAPGRKVSRQTVSYLSRRFEEVGLNPNKRHGQNFLVDLNLIQLIARTADVGPNDVVLEVGTGMGSLTGILAKDAALVITVEIDGYLYQMASEELESFENIQMLQQDALKNKNQFDVRVMDAIGTALAEDPNRRFKLAANLPYNIATPVIANLLRSQHIPDLMSVTIQKELADRITARPGSKDYGALSVWVQSLCDTELVRVMAPHVFWPRPKVDSAILKIAYRPEKHSGIRDVDFFYAFVRAMFFHRRKYLRSVAVSAFKGQLDKPQVDSVLTGLALKTDARTEQLSMEQLQELCEAFRKKLSEVLGVERPKLANQGN